MDKLQVSAGLRAVLSVPCQLVGVPLRRLSGYFSSHGFGRLFVFSWRLKESGSKMAEVFIRRFQELGG